MSDQSKYKNMSDDALDNLFRDAHAQEGTENLFSDSFWNEMEAMLPPVADKKRRPVFVWLAAAFILLVGSIYGVLFINNSKYSSKSSVYAAVNPSVNSAKVELTTSHLNKSNLESNKSRHVAPISNVLEMDKTNREITVHKLVQSAHEQKNNIQSTQPSSLDNVSQHDTNDNDYAREPALFAENNSVSLFEDLSVLPKRDIETLTYSLTSFNKPKRVLSSGYVEFGLTLGQTPYKNENGSRDIVAGCLLGGGVQIYSGKTFFQGGVQLRMEGFKGLSYVETNFTEDIQRYVQVKQLYSVEFPLSFGYSSFHHQVGISFTPGIQCFMGGNERIVQNNNEVRNSRIVGKVSHSNSATLEMGLLYYYSFNAKWSAGVKLNMDLLRPFHTDYYLGKTEMYPINGQLAIKRNLFW